MFKFIKSLFIKTKVTVLSGEEEAIMLETIRDNPITIKYIKNKTEAMVITAIESQLSPYVVREIYYSLDNHTDTLNKAIVNSDIRSMYYIKNPSDELILSVIGDIPKALSYAVNQTDELCLAVVKINGMALKYVNNHTKEITLAAIDNDYRAAVYNKIL